MNSITDDNDVRDLWNLDSLVYSIPDNKKFSFYRSDANSLMQCFLNKIQIWMNMQNGCGNIIFDTGIWNGNDWTWIEWYIENNAVKVTNWVALLSLSLQFAW